MRIQEMDSRERIAVYENNKCYRQELASDFPAAGIDELIELWLDLCVDYAGYDDIGPDFKRRGMAW